RAQRIGVRWGSPNAQHFVSVPIKECVETALMARRQIIEDRWKTYVQKKEKLDKAEEALSLPRLVGNLVVAAFFADDNDRRRKQRLEEVFTQLTEWQKTPHNLKLRQPLAEVVEELKKGERTIRPFHWEIEFPEVFGRDNPGFDCIVGNPPFMGGSRISTLLGDAYLDWVLA